MEFLFEALFQFGGELLLQLLFELVAEATLRSMAGSFSPARHPILAGFGFAIWGAAAGGLSLWVFPHSAIHKPLLRVLNLILTPVAVGAALMLLGRLRTEKGQELVRLDRFGYAFVFAAAMALIRFVWAT